MDTHEPRLLIIGYKECRGTLFAPHYYYTVGDKECRGTVFVSYITPAKCSVINGTLQGFVSYIIKAILSVGIHSLSSALHRTALYG